MTKKALYKVFCVGELKNSGYTEAIAKHAELCDQKENAKPKGIYSWSGTARSLRAILKTNKKLRR